MVCGLPWTPIRYRGWLQGGAVVSDATGAVLARRDLREGPGVVVAEIEPGRRPPLDEIPDRFWMHRRGAVPALLWEYQKLHGRLWYERHAHGRPTADQLDPALAAPPPAVRV